MQPVDFFHSRIDAMINLKDPQAVLSTRLPLNQIETVIAAKFERENRSGQILKSKDMFGTSEVVVGGGRSNAGRPKLPIHLMVSLLYLKNSFNLSNEELVVRWGENILWQYFSGMDYFEHRLPCDATQKRWRPGSCFCASTRRPFQKQNAADTCVVRHNVKANPNQSTPLCFQ